MLRAAFMYMFGRAYGLLYKRATSIVKKGYSIRSIGDCKEAVKVMSVLLGLLTCLELHKLCTGRHLLAVDIHTLGMLQ